MRKVRLLTLLTLQLALLMPSWSPAHALNIEAEKEKYPVLFSMKTELDRNFAAMKSQGSSPVYFLAYRGLEGEHTSVSGKWGSLSDRSDPMRFRFAQVELRVGSPKLDNSHILRGYNDSSVHVVSETLPIDNNDIALRTILWRLSDKAFWMAQKRFALIKANKDVKVEELDQSDDFTIEQPQTFAAEPLNYNVNREEWEEKIRRLSGVFNKFPEIKDSYVRFTCGAQVNYLVSSEGSCIQDTCKSNIVSIYADTVANDGMVLWLFDRFEANNLNDLPSEEALTTKIEDMANKLKVLRTAPLAEPFVGPAILNGKAAAVFFHETLGHRLEGHRQKDEGEGRTFKEKVGTQILPNFISIVDDPSRFKLNDTELSGYYKFDDEGVPSRPVTLVDHGKLKGFLMSRSPVSGYPHSNGHGRCNYGTPPCARQGNLMVVADQSKTISYDQLRAKLIDEMKKQGKSYGLIFDEIAGGSTMTQVGEPQLFRLYPLLVTKVYADGRKDEMIRGVDIVGTPLASLEQIEAASNETQIFNGECGAESGWISVSASAPSLLVKTIEVQRKQKSDEKPPLLPDPSIIQAGAQERK
ncbi:hypothetical protein KA183_10740 [bacterium]|nr:hypothetical protein [bacterium]